MATGKMKIPSRIDVAARALKVRDSHAAVVEGIATHAEKHRVALHAKRDKLASDKMLSGKMPNGH